MNDFLNKFFITPIYTGEGYNIYNTIAYGLLIAILGWIIYKFLMHEKIKIDFKMFKALIPYVFALAFLHVLSDAGVYPRSFFTVTPGIFILSALMIFPSYFISKWIAKKTRTSWHKPFFIIGVILAVTQGIYYTPRDLSAFLLLALLNIISSGAIIISSIKVPLFRDRLNLSVLVSHMIDSSATIASLEFYGYFEQHVLPSLWINFFGVYSFYILKLIILLPVIYYLSKSKDKDLSNFVKIAFALFGLAAGIRTSLRLVMGV